MRTPKAIKAKIAPTWAIRGADLGAHQTKVIQRRPNPRATRALHQRVDLKPPWEAELETEGFSRYLFLWV